MSALAGIHIRMHEDTLQCAYCYVYTINIHQILQVWCQYSVVCVLSKVCTCATI
jgi:hypothetical protein